MPRLHSFQALRYAPDAGQHLMAAPDAGSEAERQSSIQDPLHPVHLVTALNPDAVLRQWWERGELVQDGQAALHVLEIQSTAEGVLPRRSPARYLLGAISPGDGLLPLEQEARNISACSPMPLLAADDHHVLRTLLAEACSRAPAAWEARSEAHVLRLWPLADGGLQQRVQQVLENVLVRPLGPVPTRGRHLAALIPLSDPGLSLRPLHRALRGVEIFHPERFLTLVQEFARIYELDSPLTTAVGRARATEQLAMLAPGYHAVLLVLPGGQGRILRFRQGLELEHIRAAPRNPTLRSLDLALLNALVLRTVLGIQDPEMPGHSQVFQAPSLETLVQQVDAGKFQAGFALNPPPVWEIRAVMEAAQQLPALTLRVEPLPPAGVLFVPPEP